jgi:hypothetical protein
MDSTNRVARCKEGCGGERDIGRTEKGGGAFGVVWLGASLGVPLRRAGEGRPQPAVPRRSSSRGCEAFTAVILESRAAAWPPNYSRHARVRPIPPSKTSLAALMLGIGASVWATGFRGHLTRLRIGASVSFAAKKRFLRTSGRKRRSGSSGGASVRQRTPVPEKMRSV